jgi:hypothetical protein
MTLANPETIMAVPNAYLATDMNKLVIPSGGIVNFKGTASTPTYVT